MAENTGSSMISLVFCSIIFFSSSLCVSQAHHHHKLAPALYAFGDSSLDPGNNNNLFTFGSNHTPYGIDFPFGPTGRPTNGYNCADFFARWLGLNLPPAVRKVNSSDYKAIEHGVNYASSAAGILPETATNAFKGILSLDSQIELFKKTVKEDIPSHFPSKRRLKKHLAKSIFLVIMGTNDYVFTFLKQVNTTNPADYKTSADFLLQNLADRLTELYKLGARKFVVFDIGALGCQPSNLMKLKPSQNSNCVDYLNAIVLIYNQKLPVMLAQLQRQLPGMNFVVANFFETIMNLVQFPELYGVTDTQNPCCEVTKYGDCNATKPVCSDRNSYVYFDAFHGTEATYKLLAHNCFHGTGTCFPMNVKQLALL